MRKNYLRSLNEDSEITSNPKLLDVLTKVVEYGYKAVKKNKAIVQEGNPGLSLQKALDNLAAAKANNTY